MSKKKSGAQILIEALKNNGTDFIVGIHGAQTLPVLDVLYDQPSIKVITVRHEEASAFLCMGYTRATGKPGACFSIPGPGATNMVTSITSAYEDSLPVVFISARLPFHLFDRSASHKCDIEGIFRPITKEIITCQSLDDIPKVVNHAFQVSTEGRSGPVLITIPYDLFTSVGDINIEIPRKRRKVNLKDTDVKIEQIAEILNQAESPTIYAGGGVARSQASQELIQLSERLSAPVITSNSGRGVIPENHRLSAGTFNFAGSKDIIAKSDVCLALGTKFSEFSTLSWTAKFPDTLIDVNISSDAMGKVYSPTLKVVTDTKYALQKLLERVKQKPDNNAMLAMVTEYKEEYEEFITSFMRQKPAYPLHPLWMATVLRRVLDSDTIFVPDATSAFGWLHERSFTVYKPNTLLFSFNLGAMGYSLPASIGIKLGNPELKVVCIVGDGSFMMQMGELATATAYQVSLPIIIMNNGYYGVLRQLQHHMYNQRFIGTELNNPDFQKLAEAFDIPCYRVNTPEEFEPIIKQSMVNQGPTIIDVPLDINPMLGLVKK